MPWLDQAYSFAVFLSRNPDAAQDIVQDAYLRAYRSFGSYRGGDGRAWILRIVRDCYRAWLNERRRSAQMSGAGLDETERDAVSMKEVASVGGSPEAGACRNSEAEAVHDVLNAMPRPLREVIFLREIESLSYCQIAIVTSLPVGTVMFRLSRARRRFADIWQGRSAHDGASRIAVAHRALQ
jgi:RNA polymerase sigma-70 factor (ECF subfamily)